MSDALTKQDLSHTIGEFRKDINGRFEKIDGRFDGIEVTITANTKDIISHFIASQGQQNERMDTMDERFDGIDAKLDAIIEMLTVKQELHNLVRQLGTKGITLDESKIFLS